jgi:cytidine deaminase
MEDLLRAARAARANAYAPYSGFAVGAAVRGGNGGIYSGCNVENAAYPMSTCAEAAAVSAMVADGERRIDEVLVVVGGPVAAAPCGGCRQILGEFADGGLRIHLCADDGVEKTVSLGELLVLPFGPDNLK